MIYHSNEESYIVESDDDLIFIIGVTEEDIKGATLNGVPFKQGMKRKEFKQKEKT
jgi:hypothetical protein